MSIRKFFNTNSYEYCRRCGANLTMQNGYSNTLARWICKGCGEMLINPEIKTETDIVWICDNCDATLNIQEGFSEDSGEHICVNCGYTNKLDDSEVFLSNDEYERFLCDPYRGLSNDSLIEIMQYEEVGFINDRQDIILVKKIDTDDLYVKKILSTYNIGVYKFLAENPVECMPRIYGVYEGKAYLVVIEEYIKGDLLSDIIGNRTLDEKKAIDIARQLCVILNQLHSFDEPVIHRDVKPSNVIVNGDGKVYLLDFNAAKLFKEGEIEDTRLLGTFHYAAPEQLGYGWSASSVKADVYSLGVLLNVMVTGKLPKEKCISGPLGDVVVKCVNLNPEERYSVEEVLIALDKAGEYYGRN